MYLVITGATGAERIYDTYPNVDLEMVGHRTFDGRIQLVEFQPRVLDALDRAATTTSTLDALKVERSTGPIGGNGRQRLA